MRHTLKKSWEQYSAIRVPAQHLTPLVLFRLEACNRTNHLPSFQTTTMASSGHRSHEGYTSSPPSSDPHDPFGSQQNHQRYYDDGSEEPYAHRDTYASDSNSVHNYQDGERYYDQQGYDAYSTLFIGAIRHMSASQFTPFNPIQTPILRTTSTANALNPRLNRSPPPAWESPSPQRQQ